MKKYVIKYSDGNEQDLVVATFASRKEAAEELLEQIKIYNESNDLDWEDDDYLTPFDFIIETIESDVNEIITDFETAREHLGGKPNTDFTVSQKVSRNAVRLEDVTRLVQSLNPSHIEALIALNELFTIAQAWNKADGFAPDFSDWNQAKYYPWFKYDKDAAGFVYAFTNSTPTVATAYVGSRLCFQSSARAAQFGKQFAHLYNKVFLLNQ